MNGKASNNLRNIQTFTANQIVKQLLFRTKSEVILLTLITNYNVCNPYSGMIMFSCSTVSVWLLFLNVLIETEMQTIVTDVHGVCVCHAANSASLCGDHSVQPLPNHFGLLYCMSLGHMMRISK